MIVYNLKVRVDRFIMEEWVQWMQQTYIPKAMETGHFSSCQVMQLHRDERGGRTYSFLFYSKSDEGLDDFLDHVEPELNKEQTARFRGKYTENKSFLTHLDTIES